ncbi:hypothetical protein L915_10639 [Phytophthora nicotianae]|uniref:Uncharacterized protein n=1 Tax=Phytophthora nicotianae TaxID=4792 RepID=W2GPZ2_PHYNI|nr:hypothetical protein L915_10639 [Phytophthora nicotianae]
MADDDGTSLTIKERTMRFLEKAAEASIKCITPHVGDEYGVALSRCGECGGEDERHGLRYLGQ